MDTRVLRRWAAERPRQPLRDLGVDEIFLGKTVKFLTVYWEERQTLRDLFTLNRRLAKASLLTEQLAQLWTYTDEGAARRCLTTWLLALRWQRLPAFQKLGRMLTRHLDGILRYCHEEVPFGPVEAINGNIRTMLRRGRGYRDHAYLLLKVLKATASGRLCQTA